MKLSIIPALFLTLLWGSIAACAPPSEDAAETQFYQGLRDRGLFSLVESTLQTELAEPQLTPDRRTFLQLELSRTFAAHAGQRLGEEQAELWQLAQSVANSGLNSDQETQWTPRLMVQSALVPLEKTRFELAQFRIIPHEINAERIRTELQTHLQQLRKLELELNQRSRSVLSRYRANPQQISPYEFRTVQKQVIYEIAQTLTEIAELEYETPADRSPPIRAALDRLKVLTSGAEDERITWKARLLAIRCEWLQHDFETARVYARRYEDEWPTSFQSAVVGEQARIDLENQQPDLALERLHEWRKKRGYLSGELSLLQLQALSSLWELAWKNERPQLAEELAQQLESAAQRTQREIGGIWGWRSRLLVDYSRQATQYGPEIASRLRTAQATYQRGDYEAAVSQYKGIADLAKSQGRTEVASEMLFTAGSVLLQTGDYETARDLFKNCVDQFPDAKRAADCHLMWAWCLGKTYEQSPTKSHRLAYTAALDEHLETFKESETTGSAHLMYGQFQENRLQDTIAVEHYLAVPPDHAKAVIADLSLLRCYRKILERLKAQNRSTNAWREEAIRQVSARTAEYPQAPDELSQQQCQAILGLVRLQMEQGTRDDRQISASLNRVIEACSLKTSQDESSQAWKETALAAYRLKIVSLAQSGRTREAEALIAQIANAGRQSLLELLNGLSQAAEKANPQTKKGIAELQLETCESLNAQRDLLSPAQQQLLDRTKARALILAERSVEAHEMYEDLIQQSPDDLQLRRELAKSLSDCGTVSCYHRALEHWQYLEDHTEKGTLDWLRYRAEVIQSLIQVGKSKEAAKLLKITRLLYPEIGDETLREKYTTLQQKIDREK